ncbi:hypothetical protein HMPREF9233_00843 [Actinobaculum massiliense ACS-171-V-Col2]|uniref:Uncharacterized protein n=1 Tax=Actinobaculum massiliense ACS-171-V-Col2 TaxID=883066 RepID=K9EVS2_9ACTO|nr:hypothetical protein HMPREF9233_00843 [Actinobaculum massiliense ACS-171-V-Col2]
MRKPGVIASRRGDYSRLFGPVFELRGRLLAAALSGRGLAKTASA